MKEFKVGDRVKIAEIHKNDGYFGKKDIWIKEPIIIDAIQTHIRYHGYFYATIHVETTGETHYLYAVKFKPVEDKSSD